MGLLELQQIRAQRDIIKPKKIYHIPKMSKKKQEQYKAQKESGTDSSLDKWFEERRKEMKGRCVICGGTTLKANDQEYRRSIHHLFDKKPTLFPSVSTHPDNWLEVCFYGNSCHTNIHSKKITWELLLDSKEGEIIIEKFKKILPYIAQNEIKNIPQILIDQLA